MLDSCNDKAAIFIRLVPGAPLPPGTGVICPVCNRRCAPDFGTAQSHAGTQPYVKAAGGRRRRHRRTTIINALSTRSGADYSL